MDRNISDRISIQVTLSGYSFKIDREDGAVSSGWLGAECIFTTPEFQRRHDIVELSLLTPKCTLVPSQFFDPLSARGALSDVVSLQDGDKVEFVEVPQFDSVLVWSSSIGESLSGAIAMTLADSDGNHPRVLPEMYYILQDLGRCQEYNKILASWHDSCLNLAVGQGRSLLLCNSYEAVDFTSAEYFIFLSLKKLQLNPEVSTICFRTPLSDEQKMSLYRYFKAVEEL